MPVLSERCLLFLPPAVLCPDTDAGQRLLCAQVAVAVRARLPAMDGSQCATPPYFATTDGQPLRFAMGGLREPVCMPVPSAEQPAWTFLLNTMSVRFLKSMPVLLPNSMPVCFAEVSSVIR